MKTKNFLVGGIVGGIVDFLLGWLFYGILLTSFFPSGDEMNMTFVFLGCMTYGFFMSYILTGITQAITAAQGFKIGAVIGLFIGLYGNFFMQSSTMEVDYQTFALDLVVTIIMSAIVGAVIAAINGKMK